MVQRKVANMIEMQARFFPQRKLANRIYGRRVTVIVCVKPEFIKEPFEDDIRLFSKNE